jgi:protein gp37
MAQATSIEWTDATWNPVTGCTKISPGCKHCYAERMAKRLQAMGQPRYRNAFKVTLQPDAVEQPLRWKKPRMVFVNSMSDLFHKDVPARFIADCFGKRGQKRRQNGFPQNRSAPFSFVLPPFSFGSAIPLCALFSPEETYDGKYGEVA